MKTMRFLLVLAILLPSLVSNGQNKAATKSAAKTEKIEVYYFHFTRRCMTCNAVETESKKAVEAMYPNLVKSGKITFKAFNLDDATCKTVAERCGAEGQSLLVIGSGKRIDLTSQGFQYAVNNPDKLKAELKKAIDPLI